MAIEQVSGAHIKPTHTHTLRSYHGYRRSHKRRKAVRHAIAIKPASSLWVVHTAVESTT